MFSYILCVAPRFRKPYQSIIFFGSTIYNYQGKEERVLAILNEAVQYLNKTAICFTMGIVLSTISFAVYPLYTYLWLNERPRFVPVILPFVHPDSESGYYLCALVQIFMSTTAIGGTIGIEIIVSMIVNNMYVAVGVIEFELDKLSHLILKSELGSLGIKQALRNILMQVQDFDRYFETVFLSSFLHLKSVFPHRYTSTVANFFYWRFLLQPIFASITIAAAIFFHRKSTWTSGYGYASLTYIQLLVLCFGGNLVKIEVRVFPLASKIKYKCKCMFSSKKHRLQVAIYSFKWYLLPVHEQKLVRDVLMRIRNIRVLSIGPFADLDFETASIVSSYLIAILR